MSRLCDALIAYDRTGDPREVRCDRPAGHAWEGCRGRVRPGPLPEALWHHLTTYGGELEDLRRLRYGDPDLIAELGGKASPRHTPFASRPPWLMLPGSWPSARG